MSIESIDALLFAEGSDLRMAIAVIAALGGLLIAAYPVPRRKTPSKDYALSFLGGEKERKKE